MSPKQMPGRDMMGTIRCLSLPMMVRSLNQEGTTVERAELRDFSFRGVRFSSERKFEPGAPIEFVLTLPKEITMAGEIHIRCYGHVVLVHKHKSRHDVGALIERYEVLPGPHEKIELPEMRRDAETQNKKLLRRYHKLADKAMEESLTRGEASELRQMQRELEHIEDEQAGAACLSFDEQHRATLQKLDDLIAELRRLNAASGHETTLA